MEEVIKLQVTNLVQRNVGDFAKSNSATEKEIDCKVYQHPNFVRSTYSAMYTTLNIDSQLAMICAVCFHCKVVFAVFKVLHRQLSEFRLICAPYRFIR